jgi:hypothetical protein
VKNRIELLRGQYDTAFQTWAEETARLQRVRSNAAAAVCVEGAEMRATSAESTYRETRDQLVKELSVAVAA